jgi:hypothetical protein
MIEAAQHQASLAGVSPEFFVAQGEEYQSDTQFYAAICLFTTLGQMDDTGDNRGLVKHTGELLVPEGTFILEVPNHYWVAENLESFSRFGDEDNFTEITREFRAREKIVSERFLVKSPGETNEFLLRYRLYDQKELGNLFKEGGFIIKAIMGDFEGRPYTYYSPNIILIAQRS